jgi:Ca2+-binding EF-hand superfamily protein
MSIGGIGVFGGANDQSQMLLRMLARLDSSGAPASASTSNNGAFPAAATVSDAGPPTVTGSNQVSLSNDVLALLVQLQQQNVGAETQVSAGITASQQTISASDPVLQLFNAMDTNGDGSVSEAEMEAYIEGKGGTQSQADALYAALTQENNASGASGLSEAQFASDVSQAQGPGHHHHHHHGSFALGALASDPAGAASQIFNALDTNHDGTVSADEFAAAFSPNSSAAGSGTAINPSSVFAQIDQNGDGSITSNELGSFITALDQKIQSAASTLGSLGQIAVSSYDSSAQLLNNSSGSGAIYA